MGATILVGTGFGDEGKGRVAHALAPGFDIVARANGGPNAGHTVMHDGKRYVLKQVPAGVFFPDTRCVVGEGMVLDLVQLAEELRDLRELGVDTSGVRVSRRAHLLLPYHQMLERLWEANLGPRALTTTSQGIGMGYADRAVRTGLRVGDLEDRAFARERLSFHLAQKGALLAEIGERARIEEPLLAAFDELRPLVADTHALVHAALASGERVLVEGAQGTLLDLDLGFYPYVTSSRTTAQGAMTSLALSAANVDAVLGVSRLCQTRQGRGPMPTELAPADERAFRRAMREHGLRVGWLDLYALRYAARVNGLTGLVLTCLDGAAALPELRVCVGYEGAGEHDDYTLLPEEVLAAPRYEVWAGADGAALPAEGAVGDLPAPVRAWIRRIEEAVGVPVVAASTGRAGGLLADGPIPGAS